jgi:uncharacterized protein
VLLPDVNVLVYAHREDAPNHAACRRWLEALVNGDEAYGLSDLVLSGFVRVVTHPRIFIQPSTMADAIAFTRQLRGQSNCGLVGLGAWHWAIFERLCTEAVVRGNLVPYAYLAALAIESGCEWITTDRDFSRFSGLRWRHSTQ